MPSSQYVPMTSRGRMSGLSRNTVGGAVPLLLTKIIKDPIRGGALNEPAKANIMVGQITKSSTAPEKQSAVSIGGELLNNLSKLKFGTGTKKRDQENIKFVY